MDLIFDVSDIWESVSYLTFLKLENYKEIQQKGIEAEYKITVFNYGKQYP